MAFDGIATQLVLPQVFEECVRVCVCVCVCVEGGTLQTMDYSSASSVVVCVQ